MMQTDVKSIHISANGVIFAGRCRVKGFFIKSGTGSAQLDFYDNASAASGTIKMSIDTLNTGAITGMLIPGEGILFENGCYLNGFNTGVTITVFYG